MAEEMMSTEENDEVGVPGEGDPEAPPPTEGEAPAPPVETPAPEPEPYDPSAGTNPPGEAP